MRAEEKGGSELKIGGIEMTCVSKEETKVRPPGYTRSRDVSPAGEV